MTKNMILTSSFANVYTILNDSQPSNKIVCFIDTANLVESYTGYIDDVRLTFDKLDIKVLDGNVSSDNHTTKKKLRES